MVHFGVGKLAHEDEATKNWELSDVNHEQAVKMMDRVKLKHPNIFNPTTVNQPTAPKPVMPRYAGRNRKR